MEASGNAWEKYFTPMAREMPATTMAIMMTRRSAKVRVVDIISPSLQCQRKAPPIIHGRKFSVVSLQSSVKADVI
jgi:hypothetical protein